MTIQDGLATMLVTALFVGGLVLAVVVFTRAALAYRDARHRGASRFESLLRAVEK